MLLTSSIFAATVPSPTGLWNTFDESGSGKPIIGMQIINGLTLKKSVWQKGSVFDPKTGNSYRAKVWVDDDKLLVRGYVGFLYQTQYWEKATE